MNAFFILAQILSVVAMGIAILSFQCKKSSMLCTMQAISGGMFSISYIMFQSPTAAVMNAINIYRGVAFGVMPKKTRTFSLVILLIAYTLSSYFTYQGWISVLLLIAQWTGSTLYWLGNGKYIRIAQFFVISPIWLTQNILCKSIGGIGCEVLTLLSIIISLIRYGFNGFER